MIFRWRSKLITLYGFVMMSLKSLSIFCCIHDIGSAESDQSCVIAHWNFNDNTGDVLTDVNGNSHNGIRLRFYLNNKLTNELFAGCPIEYSVNNAIKIGPETSQSDAIYEIFNSSIDKICISNHSLKPEEFLQFNS
tara:strand:+ start:396 stop:803 length:408 start_codon:yes stop_codon:yes gene_type:complete